MKFSVCLDSLFSGCDTVESMKAVKSAGIDVIEFWRWWEKDVNAIKKAKHDLQMEVSTFCTRFISLVDPSVRGEYLKGLKESCEVAKELGCSLLITTVGDEIPGVSRDEQHKSIVDGLKACIPVLEQAGVTLVFEPLNTFVNHKGYYLYSSEEAFRIADEVGSGNVKVLYDVYHQQVMEGNIIPTIVSNINKIGHFHIAGNPGRCELEDGEINHMNVFKAIDKTGYTGFMGLEYFPVKDPAAGLKKLLAEYKGHHV